MTEKRSPESPSPPPSPFKGEGEEKGHAPFKGEGEEKGHAPFKGEGEEEGHASFKGKGKVGEGRDIALVRERLAAAKNVMVITGAGISAESGVPTFRDDKGLWKEFNPLDYATREAFKRDPVKVWKWYDERRRNAAAALPNPAHIALAKLEQTGKRVFIVTQNVDDLHERAGSREVVHIHGSYWRLRCERDGTVLENREVPLSELPPLCMCGEIMRPDVVWFGEELPWQPVEQIRHYLLEDPVDLCLVVGTEATFGYILQWALHAREAGALVVDVNPRDTGLGSLVDVHLRGKAGEVLPRLL